MSDEATGPSARPDATDTVAPGRPAVPPGDCIRCGNPIASIGLERFRVGGTGGGWKLLFGELAEVGEGMIDLEVFVCATCRHVELRLGDNDS